MRKSRGIILCAAAVLLSGCGAGAASVYQTEDCVQERTEAAGQLTAEQVIRLAGVTGKEDLARRLAGLPEPDIPAASSEMPDDALNRIACWEFQNEGEAYELQISYCEDGALDYIALLRKKTKERLNLYESEENLAHFGAVLEESIADEEDIRTFFGTHRQMRDYLTLELPEELYCGTFDAAMGTGGGSLFLTENPDLIRRLEKTASYVESGFVPEEWWAAGAAVRYTGGWPEPVVEEGVLRSVGILWNHSEYGEGIPLTDCEAPALLCLVRHELGTASFLEQLEAEQGSVPEECLTSRMWYVFFAEPDSGTVYSVSLNADFYSQEDIRRLARSVHFLPQHLDDGSPL